LNLARENSKTNLWFLNLARENSKTNLWFLIGSDTFSEIQEKYCDDFFDMLYYKSIGKVVFYLLLESVHLFFRRGVK